MISRLRKRLWENHLIKRQTQATWSRWLPLIFGALLVFEAFYVPGGRVWEAGGLVVAGIGSLLQFLTDRFLDRNPLLASWAWLAGGVLLTAGTVVLFAAIFGLVR
jgi:predicted metal-binding membrane protein